MRKADIGVIGLAVMGENLVLNMESKGFTVAVFNRTTSKVSNFVAKRANGKNIIPTYSLKELVESLKSPRKIMMMIKAGSPVDDMINSLMPLLSQGDIIIDGGNSNYRDTIRRVAHAEENGLLYIGTGVSGGEEGALKGPSLMPGGSAKAWPYVKPIFTSICAKVDGAPCCDWVGENGAGHFTKMIHNGIEYGDMELICESYDILKRIGGKNADELASIFSRYNKGRLNSYLIEITADIFRMKDTDGSPLIDKILDTAGQKGTGKWSVEASLDYGVPLSLISEAVYARCLSGMLGERQNAQKILPSVPVAKTDAEQLENDIESALYAAKIISYAQGFAALKTAAATNGWNLDYGKIALMWRGGCIIRSTFLGKIKEAFDKNNSLDNLMLDEFFADALVNGQGALRRVVALAVTNGIPVPCFSSAISYYDGYRTARLPANLLQAQRDYFGAHTYERTDSPRGKFFHTDWNGLGGMSSASTYSV